MQVRGTHFEHPAQVRYQHVPRYYRAQRAERRADRSAGRSTPSRRPRLQADARGAARRTGRAPAHPRSGLVAPTRPRAPSSGTAHRSAAPGTSPRHQDPAPARRCSSPPSHRCARAKAHGRPYRATDRTAFPASYGSATSAPAPRSRHQARTRGHLAARQGNTCSRPRRAEWRVGAARLDSRAPSPSIRKRGVHGGAGIADGADESAGTICWARVTRPAEAGPRRRRRSWTISVWPGRPRCGGLRARRSSTWWQPPACCAGRGCPVSRSSIPC